MSNPGDAYDVRVVSAMAAEVCIKYAANSPPCCTFLRRGSHVGPTTATQSSAISTDLHGCRHPCNLLPFQAHHHRHSVTSTQPSAAVSSRNTLDGGGMEVPCARLPASYLRHAWQAATAAEALHGARWHWNTVLPSQCWDVELPDAEVLECRSLLAHGKDPMDLARPWRWSDDQPLHPLPGHCIGKHFICGFVALDVGIRMLLRTCMSPTAQVPLEFGSCHCMALTPRCENACIATDVNVHELQALWVDSSLHLTTELLQGS